MLCSTPTVLSLLCSLQHIFEYICLTAFRLQFPKFYNNCRHMFYLAIFNGLKELCIKETCRYVCLGEPDKSCVFKKLHECRRLSENDSFWRVLRRHLSNENDSFCVNMYCNNCLQITMLLWSHQTCFSPGNLLMRDFFQHEETKCIFFSYANILNLIAYLFLM